LPAKTYLPDLARIPQINAATPPIKRKKPYIQGRTTVPARGFASKSTPSIMVRIPRTAVLFPPP
jgi:hypothetical protein